MILPELNFKYWFKKEENEIFFTTDNQIRNVVSQGIPGFIVIKLPGLFTKVIAYFPEPFIVKIYAKTSYKKGNINHPEYYFIGEGGDKGEIKNIPDNKGKKYGMEIAPWMYKGHGIPNDVISDSRIINYVVENCTCAYSGIIIRFRDELDKEKRNKEWFKIYWFNTSNEMLFRDETCTKGQELINLVPKRKSNGIFTWQPVEGWDKFKKIENFPFLQI